MCMGGQQSTPTPPPPAPLPPPPPPPMMAPAPALQPKLIQPTPTSKTTLQIGGSRRTDTSRKRRGATAVSAAPAINAGPGGGVNV